MSEAKQCWFADDATGCGSLQNIRVQWEELTVARPDLGYNSSDGTCWLVTKLDEEKTARSTFEETVINITTEGWKHLVVALGSQFYLEEYINS